ncbi:MAG: ribose-5-phosphate isomerase A [Acidimicrobiales bacterium]
MHGALDDRGPGRAGGRVGSDLCGDLGPHRCAGPAARPAGGRTGCGRPARHHDRRCGRGGPGGEPDQGRRRGAHAEKIVAAMADRFVVVVDDSKLVPALGPFGTPLEVLDFAPGVVADAVRRLGASRVDRLEERSDNGNVLLRAWFPSIGDPADLAAALAAVPGVVEHGIFLGTTVDAVFVASTAGVRRLPGGRPQERR